MVFNYKSLKISFLMILVMFFAGISMHAQTILINPAGDGGFENGSTFAANGWTTVNATVNTWQVGTAAGWHTGTNGAYVSSNNGTSWNYNSGVTQASAFYKDVVFPAGETMINLTFDWRGNGNDGNYDNLQVYVTDVTVAPTTNGPTGISTTATDWPGYTNGTNGYYLLRRNGSNVPTSTTTVSYNFTNNQSTYAAGNTRRIIFVWKNDGSDGENPPASVDNISLTSACPGVTSAAASGVAQTTADANWNDFTGATSYNVRFRIVGTTTWTTISNVAGLTVNLPGLQPAAIYEYQVQANGPVCNTWSTSASFTTLCGAVPAPTAVQTFADYEGDAPGPLCWSEAQGTLEAVSDLTVTDSYWYDAYGFANAGSNTAAKINLYGEGEEWLISQEIDLGTGDFRLKYKMAVTDYDDVNVQATMGTHRVDVVISTDGGATWSNTNILRTYTGAGSYSNTGQTEIIDLSSYSGSVKIAFVSTTVDESPDLDFHLDDFVVEIIPDCIEPTAITATTTSNQAVVSWTAPSPAPANGYEYVYSTTNTPPTGAGTAIAVPTVTLSPLTPATQYYFFVRSVCGTGEFSAWEDATFTTACAPEAAPTVMQDFESYGGTAPDPICWSEARGPLTASSTPAVGSSYWESSFEFANSAADGGAVINLFGEGNEWLISNPIDLGTGDFRLRYDYALTDYGWITQQSSMGSHKVMVVISTDGGATWSDANILKTYSGVGTFSNTGETEYFNLTGYSGIVKIAFVSVTTAYSPDLEFHIDNFAVEPIPAPAITDFTSTVACGVSTELTINGTNLAGATVEIGGTPVVLTANTNTLIKATITANMSGNIEVTTPGGDVTSTTAFTFATSPAFALSEATSTVCAGSSTDAVTVTTGSADYTTYTWIPATAVSGNQTTGWTFNPSVTTNYTLNVTTATGCLNSAVYQVIAKPLPSGITIDPEAIALCVGASDAEINVTLAPIEQTAVVSIATDVMLEGADLWEEIQGMETITVNIPALPAGAVVTSTEVVFNGVTTYGETYPTDIDVTLTGVITLPATVLAVVNAEVVNAGPYSVPTDNLPVAGGSLTLLLENYYEGPATFASIDLVINYTIPNTAEISWWDASTAGSQEGTGTTFEPIGTTLLPNTNTPGVYTFYSEASYEGCVSPSRTPVVITVNAPTTASVTVTSCGDYTVNGETYTGSGIYTQTLENAAGCDSLLTINLTVNQPSGSALTATACGSYTVNGQTYTVTGVYTQTLENALGCDSIISLNLTINPYPVATATVSNQTTITASPAGGGQTYQWITCPGNTPIAGATAANYFAVANGSYAVVITNPSGCKDTSACVTISTIGLDEKTADAGISLYPNPTEGIVYVSMTAGETADIIVFDAQGKVVSEIRNAHDGTVVDLKHAQAGIYMVSVSNARGSNVFRIVKN